MQNRHRKSARRALLKSTAFSPGLYLFPSKFVVPSKYLIQLIRLCESAKITEQRITYSLSMMIKWALPNQLNELALRSVKQASLPKLVQAATAAPPESPQKAGDILPAGCWFQLQSPNPFSNTSLALGYARESNSNHPALLSLMSLDKTNLIPLLSCSPGDPST